MVIKWSVCEEMMNLIIFSFTPVWLFGSYSKARCYNRKNPVQGREQDSSEGGRGSPPPHIIFMNKRGKYLFCKGNFIFMLLSDEV